MILQPRKFKYKTRHKIRRFKKIQLRFTLNYGQGGLLLTQPLRVNSKKLFRLKLFLKKASRRSDDTRRKVWVNAFPHMPLTKKTIGSRMGKGKGKLSLWHTKLPTGHILIEFKNLRHGRLSYFLRQTQFKLKGSSKLIFRNRGAIVPSAAGKGQVRYQSFW